MIVRAGCAPRTITGIRCGPLTASPTATTVTGTAPGRSHGNTRRYEGVFEVADDDFTGRIGC